MHGWTTCRGWKRRPASELWGRFVYSWRWQHNTFESRCKTASEMTDLDGVDVDGEDACSIVGEQCGQGTANNLGPVHYQSSVGILCHC